MPKEVKIDMELAKKANDKPKLTDVLAPQFAAFGQTPEAVKREFLKATSINSELKKADPTSLLLGVAQVMSLELSLDPTEGQTALIPYQMGMKSVAQLQIMWKGYRQLLLKNAIGVKDLINIEVKEGDIDEWDPLTGQFKLSKNFENKDFTYQLERKNKETIGYLSLIILDKNEYGQENFGSFMTTEEIKEWKQEYGSKTKINDASYGRKTTAKRVIRDFKHKLKWKHQDNIQQAMRADQSANDGKNLIYLEREDK